MSQNFTTIDKRLAKLQARLPQGIQHPREPEPFNITVTAFDYKDEIAQSEDGLTNRVPYIVKSYKMHSAKTAQTRAWKELTKGHCVYIVIGQYK